MKKKNPVGHRPARSSFLENMKEEWSLFWEGITHAQEERERRERARMETHAENFRAGLVRQDEFDRSQVTPLDVPKIHAITKALSEERKLLNRRLESIYKEIDLNSAKLESLRVVGGDPDNTERRISELTDQGQKLSEALAALDQRLSWARKQPMAGGVR